MKEIQERMDAGDWEGAHNRLVELLGKPTTEAENLARMAERLGDATAAMRAWQLVLRDNPDHAGAWLALAELHAERGDRARAESCRKRAGVAPEPMIKQEEEQIGNEPTDADLLRYLHLFQGREDSHARMWRNGDQVGYSPVPGPLTVELMRAHWRGSVTLGVYLTRLDQTCTLFCVDLDATKAALDAVAGDRAGTAGLQAELASEGMRLVRQMEEMGLTPLLEDSGYKGRHVWVFLEEPLPAATVLAFGRQLCAKLAPASPRLRLEFFPKQGQVKEGGKGNLVKLPLGVHVRSGRRSHLLENGKVVSEPFERLRRQGRSRLPVLTDCVVADVVATEAPMVTPAPGDPGWTEADYEAQPEVASVLQGCGVLRAVVEKGLRDRRLEHDAVIAISHSLGHFPAGLKAANYLFDQIPNFSTSERLVSVLRGSPISCAKMRQRLPDIVQKIGCNCTFENAKPYPNPLLHRVEGVQRHDRNLDEMLESLVRAEDRKSKLDLEITTLRRSIVDRLERVPDRRWQGSGGEWRLEDADGLPVLRWEAK